MKQLTRWLMCTTAAFAWHYSASAADAPPKVISYPASKDLSASITLLQRDGTVGRGTPFMTGYRPQHQFSGSKTQVTCAIQIVKPKEQVDPGETAAVVINCAEGFKVIEGQRGFTVFEGGRKVAQGTLSQ
jgi:translation elongation factor EF-Tu-like GTPase